MIINSAARIIVGKARFCRGRITPICIYLYLLLTTALTHRAVKNGQPKYLSELLPYWQPNTDFILRSVPWKSFMNPLFPGIPFRINVFSIVLLNFTIVYLKS